ncbi:MAG: phosphoglycerate mutase family protein [Acidaminococcus intestini]
MILLIRHGEAEHHVKALTGGWTDSCLTADGKVQMEKLAAVLKRILLEGNHPVWQQVTCSAVS